MTNACPMLVVAAALTEDDGRVLLQQRASGALAGLWEFPGGKVDPGETPEAALVRELSEELGIVVAESYPVPIAFASAPLAERHLVLLLYRIRRWEGEPQPLAASALVWQHPQALTLLPMPAPDIPLVKALIAATPEG